MLQVSFRDFLPYLSTLCTGKGKAKSEILDLEPLDIQKLEDRDVLPGLRRKTGQIDRPVRHAETRTKML